MYTIGADKVVMTFYLGLKRSLQILVMEVTPHIKSLMIGTLPLSIVNPFVYGRPITHIENGIKQFLYIQYTHSLPLRNPEKGIKI